MTARKVAHPLRVVRGTGVCQPIDVRALRPLVTKDEGTSVPFAPGLDVPLHKHVTLSTIQPGPHSNISNECSSGPSGSGVLAGLNASGLRGRPRAKRGGFGTSNAVLG